MFSFDHHQPMGPWQQTVSGTSPAALALDALVDAEQDFSLSPDGSPTLGPADGPLAGRPLGRPIDVPLDQPTESRTAPAQEPSSTTDSFIVPIPSRPGRPGRGDTPPSKQRPRVARLNTLGMFSSPTSPTKPLSPGLRHWQQVREHVLAPTTPRDEKPSAKQQKKVGIVTKAAGRFGFRQAAENVMGYEERRRSTMGFTPNDIDSLSAEQQQELARERRRFAREIKTCLDACALQETQRRLARAYDTGNDLQSASLSSTHKNTASSTLGSTQGPPPAGFDPDFSSFVPLLTELHRHLPAARAKKPWSRTCPHHAAILSELGVCFLHDASTTDGERQQALEVFGVLVRNWASDSSDEELDRWLWLCRALLVPDRNLRNRGLPLLVSFLRADPALPPAHDRPRSAAAIQTIAIALLPLLHAVEMGGQDYEQHHQQVAGLLIELAEGIIIPAQPSSLRDILGPSVDNMVLQASLKPEREIVWLAVGRVLGQDPLLARWLIASGGDVLERFAPPPLLGATPPLVLKLRALSSEVFLTSLSRLAFSSTDSDTVRQVWQVAARFILPDTPLLLQGNSSVARNVGSFILDLQLAVHRADTEKPLNGQSDPVRTVPSAVMPLGHRETLVEMLGQPKFADGLKGAAILVAATAPTLPLTRMIQFFYEHDACRPLAREFTNSFFKRLSTSADSPEHVQAFLHHLQSTQPQVLYRPLFSLSAATNSANLQSHLRLVRALERLVGPARFWLAADPQMVAIVLMGDVAPKQDKGKGKAGQATRRPVKLGRYAALIEFILALEQVPANARKDRSTRAFVEAVEARLSVILETEEKEGDLPIWYRALICRLLQKLRHTTLSVKKSGWQKLVLGWYTLPSFSPEAPSEASTTLRSVFVSLSQGGEKSETVHTHGMVKSRSRRDDTPPSVSQDELVDLSFSVAAASLLATVQASLSREQMLKLLPRLWSACAVSGADAKAVAFLLMKCGEVIPDAWHELIMADLKSTVPTDRMSALCKLAMLHGWRFQVLSQVILTDRRGAVFHFPAQTVGQVATEIGSAAWVAPYDVQDVALKRFGTALPLELRQRLMELGWNEDDTMAVKSDWEQVPVSSLPSLEFQAGTGVADARVPSPAASPIRGLAGREASVSGYSEKRRKAIFAPVLLRVIYEQAAILAHDPESTVETASRDLVRYIQRDDAGYAIRPFTDDLGQKDFLRALAGLNAFMVVLTPAFAYTAFNSMVGYLKTALQSDATFGNYAPALASICHLAPHVSELSLRAIRKNKAEHVLLPASIHEEEAGFKMHAAWRDGDIGVQTAQLMFLTDILRANPREVYLVKKMLSNLQIQGSIGNLSFSRAWLVLIATLFSTVNRNYNDRAELRHFMTNVVAVLRLHGHKDPLVACHALRVLMLCSARFRRLFASVGFSTIVRSIYDLYVGAGSNMAIRDGIEYAARSFFRIHQEAFVYQASLAIAEGDHDDAKSAYDFLACLAVRNTDSSGVPLGLKGLNEKEEIETLLSMLSVPEAHFSDIRSDSAERQARKAASLDLEGEPFPKENIVKLFLTVIAANPATRRAAHFLRLFAAVLPHISDPVSIELVREGVEALGVIYAKGRLGDDAAREVFRPGEGDSNSDWTPAKREYVLLVESFAQCCGKLSSQGTKRSLDLVQELLRKRDDAVGPVASSILRELAQTHLSASGSRATAFLKGTAPIFRLFITSVDFSGLLAEITSLIRRSAYELDEETTRVIVESYVGPAVRMLASASEDNMAFSIPVRTATIELLAAAVFLPGDALRALERYAPNPSLLASLVFPLCLALEPPEEVDREEVYNALWIRLLHHVMRSQKTLETRKRVQERQVAATIVLCLQTLKVIILRAQAGISRVHGLWDYIAQHVISLVKGGNGYFAAHRSLEPRIIDWMMWSVFELVSLHRSPLMIELRCSIQVALSTIADESPQSALSPSGPDPRMLSGTRSRTPSLRMSLRPRASLSPEPERSRQLSAGLTPDQSFSSGHLGRVGHTRSPSLGLSPHPGHLRSPSASGPRPSFVDLSARRASRPSFTVGSDVISPLQSPRVSGVRGPSPGANGEKGGAVVQLLGAPTHVLGAISAALPTFDPKLGNDVGKVVTRDLKIRSQGLLAASRRAVTACRVVFGYEVNVEEQVRVLTVREAVLSVAEETKTVVEDEFREVFTPTFDGTRKSFEGAKESMGDAVRGYSLDQIPTVDDDDEEAKVPRLEALGVHL